MTEVPAFPEPAEPLTPVQEPEPEAPAEPAAAGDPQPEAEPAQAAPEPPDPVVPPFIPGQGVPDWLRDAFGELHRRLRAVEKRT